MIRISKAAQILLIRPENELPAVYWTKVADAGGEDSALVIETIQADGYPICPHCTAATGDDDMKAGVCSVICYACGGIYVALRFLGGGQGRQWYTFPWPA